MQLLCWQREEMYKMTLFKQYICIVQWTLCVLTGHVFGQIVTALKICQKDKVMFNFGILLGTHRYMEITVKPVWIPIS